MLPISVSPPRPAPPRPLKSPREPLIRLRVMLHWAVLWLVMATQYQPLMGWQQQQLRWSFSPDILRDSPPLHHPDVNRMTLESNGSISVFWLTVAAPRSHLIGSHLPKNCQDDANARIHLNVRKNNGDWHWQWRCRSVTQIPLHISVTKSSLAPISNPFSQTFNEIIPGSPLIFDFCLSALRLNQFLLEKAAAVL